MWPYAMLCYKEPNSFRNDGSFLTDYIEEEQRKQQRRERDEATLSYFTSPPPPTPRYSLLHYALTRLPNMAMLSCPNMLPNGHAPTGRTS